MGGGAGRGGGGGSWSIGGRNIAQFGGLFQEFLDALLGAEGALELAEDFGEGGDGAADKKRVEGEGGELAVREPSGLHESRSVPHDQRDRAEDAEDDEGVLAQGACRRTPRRVTSR